MTLTELAGQLKELKHLSCELQRLLENDRRRGARLLLERHRRRTEREQEERVRILNLLLEERMFWTQGIEFVAGVDEAGRGPLAGPVVAAAVILPPETVISGINDSKQIAPSERERLYDLIMDQATSVGTGAATVAEIEELNIFGAVMLAMRRALDDLSVAPEAVLVDGYPIRELTIHQKAIVRGDSKSASIAAASIVAKVIRDRYMIEQHYRYLSYGFNRQKGYATNEHRRALARWGPFPEHRIYFLSGSGMAGTQLK